jgi:hypothetical protein
MDFAEHGFRAILYLRNGKHMDMVGQTEEQLSAMRAMQKYRNC